MTPSVFEKRIKSRLADTRYLITIAFSIIAFEEFYLKYFNITVSRFFYKVILKTEFIFLLFSVLCGIMSIIIIARYFAYSDLSRLAHEKDPDRDMIKNKEALSLHLMSRNWMELVYFYEASQIIFFMLATLILMIIIVFT